MTKCRSKLLNCFVDGNGFRSATTGLVFLLCGWEYCNEEVIHLGIKGSCENVLEIVGAGEKIECFPIMDDSIQTPDRFATCDFILSMLDFICVDLLKASQLIEAKVDRW